MKADVRVGGGTIAAANSDCSYPLRFVATRAQFQLPATVWRTHRHLLLICSQLNMALSRIVCPMSELSKHVIFSHDGLRRETVLGVITAYFFQIQLSLLPWAKNAPIETFTTVLYSQNLSVWICFLAVSSYFWITLFKKVWLAIADGVIILSEHLPFSDYLSSFSLWKLYNHRTPWWIDTILFMIKITAESARRNECGARR